MFPSFFRSLQVLSVGGWICWRREDLFDTPGGWGRSPML